MTACFSARAGRRAQRHAVRPPTKGYWTTRCNCPACHERRIHALLAWCEQHSSEMVMGFSVTLVPMQPDVPSGEVSR